MKSATILAGGESKRFGEDKAFYKIDGKLMAEHIASKLQNIVDKVIVAVQEKGKGKKLKNRSDSINEIVYDIKRDYGPVAGLYSSLSQLEKGYMFLVGCDMPLINIQVIKSLFKEARGYDCLIPQWKNGDKEFLHSIFKVEPTEEACKNVIKNDEDRILNVIERLNKVNYYPVREIEQMDPELKTFKDFNYKEEFKDKKIKLKKNEVID